MKTEGPVYLDANVFIYAMETDGQNGTLARRWLMQVDRERIVGVTSGLTMVEVLPHPIAQGNVRLIEGYRRLFTTIPTLKVVAITSDILFRSAEMRAELHCETPDAIHVATAQHAGCRDFLTNDDRLKLPAGLTRRGLEDVMAFYR